MLLKRILLFILLIDFLPTQAQVTVSEIDLKEAYDLKKVNEIFQAVDSKSGDYCLFLLDSKVIRSILYDSNGQVKGTIQHKINTVGARYIRNHAFFDGTKFNLLLEDLNGINRYSFDFSTGKTNKESFNIRSKDSKIIAQFSSGESYYFLEIKRKTSELNFIQLSDALGFNSKHVDLGINNFKILDDPVLEKLSNSINLFEVLEYHKFYQIEAIKKTNKHTFTQAANKVKLYIYDNKVILSLDVNRKNTTLVTISLPDMKFKIQEFLYGAHSDFRRTKQEQNSFLLGNKLYQIHVQKETPFFKPSLGYMEKGDPSNIIVRITDIENEEKIQQFTASNEEDGIDWLYGSLEAEPSKSELMYNRFEEDSRAFMIIGQIVYYDAVILPKIDPITNKTALYLGFNEATNKSNRLIGSSTNSHIKAYHFCEYSKSNVSEVIMGENQSLTNLPEFYIEQIIRYVDTHGQGEGKKEVMTIFFSNSISHLAYYDLNDNTLQVIQFKQ